MMQESNQNIELLNNEKTTIKSISYLLIEQN